MIVMIIERSFTTIKSSSVLVDLMYYNQVNCIKIYCAD